MDTDVIVVGGGAAGLAAATWLARYRRRVVVFDAGEPRNRWAEQVHGYLGLDAVAPAELLRRARLQLAAYPHVRVEQASVSSVAVDPRGGFVVSTPSGEAAAHRVIIATGVADDFPALEGFFTHYGESVFHCPTCDGYEARDQPVVVFGWRDDVAGFALTLLDWAASVTIVTQGQHFEGDDRHRAALKRHGVPLLEQQAVALRGDRGDLRAAVLADGGQVPCRLGFFSITHRPATRLATQLGCALDADGYVAVDGQGQTSVEGVYAAGDVTPGLQLLQAAAADGAVAGVSCALALRSEPGTSAQAVPDSEAEMPDG